MGKLTQAQVRAGARVRRARAADSTSCATATASACRRTCSPSCARARRVRVCAERVANWERGREPAYAAALRGLARAVLRDADRHRPLRSRPSSARARSGHLRRYAEDFEALAAPMNDPKPLRDFEPDAGIEAAAGELRRAHALHPARVRGAARQRSRSASPSRASGASSCATRSSPRCSATRPTS